MPDSAPTPTKARIGSAHCWNGYASKVMEQKGASCTLMGLWNQVLTAVAPVFAAADPTLVTRESSAPRMLLWLVGLAVAGWLLFRFSRARRRT